MPISNFVTRKPEKRVGILNRIDGERTIVGPGQRRQRAIRWRRCRREVSKVVGDMDLGGIGWKLAGSNEDSEEASAFLGNAFGAAIFLIFIVLLAQFNKFTSVCLVLSCVVMATIGVLLGMLITGPGLRHRHVRHRRDRAGRRGGEQQHRADRHLRPAARGRLGQARGGAADLPRARATCGADRAVGDPRRAADRASASASRSVHHETTINAPSTQWWIALSSAIVFGLSFATVLTLVVTPSMLMVFTRSNDSRLYAFFRRIYRGRVFGRDQKPGDKDGKKPGAGAPAPAE